MHCKIEDDLSFRDVICFEVWRVAHVSICNRPAFMVKNISVTEDLPAVAVSENIQVSARVSKTLTW